MVLAYDASLLFVLTLSSLNLFATLFSLIFTSYTSHAFTISFSNFLHLPPSLANPPPPSPAPPTPPPPLLLLDESLHDVPTPLLLHDPPPQTCACMSFILSLPLKSTNTQPCAHVPKLALTLDNIHLPIALCKLRVHEILTPFPMY